MSKKDDKIAAVRSALEAALKSGPAREPSSYEAVKANLPQIRAAMAQRYTHAEILDVLKAAGLEIGLGTFRTYLQRALREAGVTPTRGPKKQTFVAATKPATPSEIKPNPASWAAAPASPAAEAPATPPVGDKGKVTLTHNPNRKL